jgi:hypothetical protein
VASTLGAVAALLLVLWPVPALGQAPRPRAAAASNTRRWSPPRTPDGQPDLQGVWLSNSATPLERPKALEGRMFLTDAEVASLRAHADRLFSEIQGAEG